MIAKKIAQRGLRGEVTVVELGADAKNVGKVENVAVKASLASADSLLVAPATGGAPERIAYSKLTEQLNQELGLEGIEGVKTALSAHTEDNVAHVTAAERAKWDGALKNDLSNATVRLLFEHHPVYGADFSALRITGATNGTRLVAVNKGKTIYYSDDKGQNWEKALEIDADGSDNPYPIVYDGIQFVACMDDEYVWTSLDGVSWTKRGTLGFNPQLCKIAAGTLSNDPSAKRYVIVRNSTQSVSVCTSLDSAWEAVNFESFEGTIAYGVAFGDGMFVVGGYNGSLAYTTDLSNLKAWTEITVDAEVSELFFADGRFVGTSGYGQFIYFAKAVDILHWTKSNQLPAKTCVHPTLATGNGIFAIPAAWNAFVLVSEDLVTWRVAASDDSAEGNNTAFVCFCGGQFVAMPWYATNVYLSTTPDVVSQLSLCGLTRVAVGSYVGTGTYGLGYENKLVFDFVPRLVYIRVANSTYPQTLLWAEGDENAFFGDIVSAVQNVVTRNGKELSWYLGTATIQVNTYGSSSSMQGCGYQLNSPGVTYNYLALG